MLFSWYSGDFCTDSIFAELPPEQRANPSMSSWSDGMAYLDQQRTRLPTGRFRRLHLNLPGSPEGAAFDQGKILACVVTGRRSLPPEPDRRYFAAVDMSGGSSDDAVLAIAHLDGKVVVIDLVQKQVGRPPFNPRDVVRQFAAVMNDYRIFRIYGDAYSGQTFRQDFQSYGIQYEVRSTPASNLYEGLEPLLNAREIELLDLSTPTEQLVSLVWRGNRITHEPNSHDDHANAVALAAAVLRGNLQRLGPNVMPIIVTTPRTYFGDHPGGSGASIYGGVYSGGGSMRNPAHGLPRDGRDSWDQRWR